MAGEEEEDDGGDRDEDEQRIFQPLLSFSLSLSVMLLSFCNSS